MFEGKMPRSGFSGQVVWAGSGRPVAGAVVLIGGTGLRAKTDEEGAFAFEEVPLGTYTLVASAPEAQVTTELVMLAEGLTPEIDIVLSTPGETRHGGRSNPEAELKALREEVKQLRAALRDANRRLTQDTDENARFERFFLGDDGEGSCSLRNPEVLTFDRRGVGNPPSVLNADAEELLEIDNQHLGYRVWVALDKFSLRHIRRDDSYSMTIEAVYSFEDLSAYAPHNRDQWERNRAEAYRGSLRHFLVALAAGRANEEGFAVVARTEVSDSQIYGSSHRFADDIYVDPAIYISPTGQPLTYWLNFPETIKVVYQDRNVVGKARTFSGIQPGPQTSWLGLSGKPVAFTAHGHLLDPEGLTVLGYWGIQQACTLLPQEYE